ncbi:oxidoreductase [Mucilaginibacter sp.]|uniref:oxidoreductase n=1 Tax=Mucilaginibacter sp. TaxID=1882438 RepID=UPI002632F8D3|nr:oxidoreductase [Mucilaginibacter sp.]MDB4926754.1 family NAD(P)-dependent oxidoreductase [Mucilaginibacter sp.]
MKTQKVWFVTGTSKGFGLEITKAVLASGDKVIATVRSKVAELTSKFNNNPDLLVVTMDTTIESQVKEAVQQGVAHFGKIDVVVNNAGYGIVTAIEEATDEETRKQYDTNVFGLLNVTRAVLPYLRKQRSGHIINISSLFGFDAIPGWALYGSTKFAVEGISKGLAAELEPFNIKVTAVEPGLFTTDFLSKESYAIADNAIDDYADTTVGQMRAHSGSLHGKQPGDPVKLAKVIVELADTKEPPLQLPLGTDAIQTYRTSAENTAKSVEKWLALSTSTDHVVKEA